MSREFDSRKDSHSTKFERTPLIFVKLSLRELCDSMLSGLHLFDNFDNFGHYAISKLQKLSTYRQSLPQKSIVNVFDLRYFKKGLKK